MVEDLGMPYDTGTEKTAMQNKAPLPDHDEWTHLDLTTTLLELAVVQIKHAMADNDESMMALAEAHQAIGNKLQAIATALTAVSADADPDDTQSNINQNLGQMIMAFQGHDVLNQRLEHVCETLEGVKTHIAEESLRDNQQAWATMVDGIEQRYTMKDERLVFKTVMRKGDGSNPPAADKADDDSDIELF